MGRWVPIVVSDPSSSFCFATNFITVNRVVVSEGLDYLVDPRKITVKESLELLADVHLGFIPLLSCLPCFYIFSTKLRHFDPIVKKVEIEDQAEGVKIVLILLCQRKTVFFLFVIFVFDYVSLPVWVLLGLPDIDVEKFFVFALVIDRIHSAVNVVTVFIF